MFSFQSTNIHYFGNLLFLFIVYLFIYLVHENENKYKEYKKKCKMYKARNIIENKENRIEAVSNVLTFFMILFKYRNSRQRWRQVPKLEVIQKIRVPRIGKGRKEEKYRIIDKSDFCSQKRHASSARSVSGKKLEGRLPREARTSVLALFLIF